jgi:regulator of sigma E protease
MVPHNVVKGEVVVAQVAPGSPAEAAGIQVGDTVISINNKPVNNFSDLSRDIQLKLGAEISIVLEHADATIETVRLVPRWHPPAGQGAVGIAYKYGDTPVVTRESLPFWRAIPAGSRTCVETLVLYYNGIVGMIIGTVPFVPAGPVGIVQVAGEIARTGISPLLELAAFISIAVGIKRVSPRVEGIIHSIGFIILLALMVLITYKDLARWITGGSLIP